MPVTMLHITRRVAGASLVVWLAACSTVVSDPGGPGAASVSGAAAVVITAPVASPAVAAPNSGLQSVPASNEAQAQVQMTDDGSPHELPLAGEIPREFERGGASWYGPRFHGRRTASGERYDMHALTAAHRTLPFGTMVRVRSMVSGHEVEVRVTDRGPFARNRVIDVSRAAAEALGMLGLGVKPVVLLVPESTKAVAGPPPSARTPRRARRAPPAPVG